MRRFINAVTCASLLVLLLGCGGGQPVSLYSATQLQQAAVDEARASLPPLPVGTLDLKRSQVVEGDTQPGDAAIDSLNGFAGATEMLLNIPDGEQLAFAVYQIPARPDPPDMFTFNTTYYDGVPQTDDPAEGFWVAYADYARDSWVFAGPFTTGQTRIPVPPEADVISPGDNLYCAVIMMSGNVVMVHSVSSSYYTDLGYESIWLAAPQGQLIGQRIDIQLDAAGNPQIAYLVTEGIVDPNNGKLRIARLDAGNWIISPIPTLYEISNIVFRLGSNGRRAVLAQSGANLHLLYDGGSGTFTGDYVVSANHEPVNMPAMSFFNAAGEPAGDRDDLMIVYSEVDVWPDFFVKSYLYDGTNPPTEQNVFLASKERVGRFSLTTNADNSLLLGDLSEPVPGDWLINTMTYTETGFWVGLPNVDWTDQPIEDDYSYQPSIATCELPDGNLAAAYIHEGGHGVVLGLSDGGAWQSLASDTIGCFPNPVIDLEPYSDGRVGFLSTYTDDNLQLFRHFPAGGSPVQVTAIDEELADTRKGSMAVDAGDVTHIATSSFYGDGLLYYTVDAEGVSSRQVVDTGGWEQGAAYGVPALTQLGDDLYVFYADQVHSQMLYSLNRNGVWIAENEIIPTDAMCHITWNAGYLENEDLLYVSFQNFWDFRTYVVTFTPGGVDFQTNLLTPPLDEPMFVADDETNLAIAYTSDSIMLGERLHFNIGPPRLAPHPDEVVSAASDSINSPHPLNYNTVEQTWLVGCQGSDISSCMIHKRSPSGMWSGPHLVAIQPGIAYAKLWAIDHDFITGINYATVTEQADGSTIRYVNVYSDSTADRHFEFPAGVMSYDTAAYNVESVVTAPTSHGWPVICLEIKPLADVDWNYRVMTPDSAFHWVPAFTWQTTCLDPVSWPGITVMSSNMPALAIIERHPDSDQYGRVLVRYPW